jgi:hypothetical protein
VGWGIVLICHMFLNLRLPLSSIWSLESGQCLSAPDEIRQPRTNGWINLNILFMICISGLYGFYKFHKKTIICVSASRSINSVVIDKYIALMLKRTGALKVASWSIKQKLPTHPTFFFLWYLILTPMAFGCVGPLKCKTSVEPRAGSNLCSRSFMLETTN